MSTLSARPAHPRQRRAFCRSVQPRRARQTYCIRCNIGNRTTSQEVNSGEDYPVESVLYHLAEQTDSFGRSIDHTLTREDETNPLLTVTTGYAPDGCIDTDGDGSLNAGFNSEIGAASGLTVGVSGTVNTTNGKFTGKGTVSAPITNNTEVNVNVTGGSSGVNGVGVGFSGPFGQRGQLNVDYSFDPTKSVHTLSVGASCKF